MPNSSDFWDYLILTAANDAQAAGYRAQLSLRSHPQVREVLVVADPQGRRAGSGGSTIHCLLEILRREGAVTLAGARTILERLRILIVHAGGDSRRLPAYSHFGKIFVPLPGQPAALFDRLVPAFLSLPAGEPGAGQVVVAAGDALILFDPAQVSAFGTGLTALAAWVSPQEAARHGVLCPGSGGAVRLFLQKPDLLTQAATGAISAAGESLLDIGVMSLDAAAAVTLLQSFCTFNPPPAVMSEEVDLYREVCCALGTEATLDRYLSSVRASGTKLGEPELMGLFQQLRSIPLHCQVLRDCGFLHFGSSSELIVSGLELIKRDRGAAPAQGILAIGNQIHGGAIEGCDSWIEGCCVRAPLRLSGRNVVVGVDVAEPLTLPPGACLDLSAGLDRAGRPVWFVRYYGVDDSFKHAVGDGATFCGIPLAAWLQAAGVPHDEVWSPEIPESGRTLWNARLFPAEPGAHAYGRWHWMLAVERATSGQKSSLLAADRYSAAEIAIYGHRRTPERNL